jgi:hypothetical protein
MQNPWSGAHSHRPAWGRCAAAQVGVHSNCSLLRRKPRGHSLEFAAPVSERIDGIAHQDHDVQATCVRTVLRLTAPGVTVNGHAWL